MLEPSAGVFKNPLVDWYQYPTPQTGLGGRKPLYTQGKTFGGGSARNFMNYQRPSKGALQKWANEVGDQSYTWERMLRFYKKSVTFTSPPSNAHGNVSLDFDVSQFNPNRTGGPVQVSFPRHINPISTWFGRAFQALGFAKVPAFSDGNLFGWSYFSYTIDPTTQTRSSSEAAFLREALRDTTNLNFYKNTLAKQILFTDKTATGVLVNTAGIQYTISAKREVILSAGAFRSAQLLMVSGVGPASTLSSLDIPILADRPGVGQNLWDNSFSGPTYPVKVETHNRLANAEFSRAAIAEYNANRTGILTNTGGDFLAFERLPQGAVSESTRRDLDDEFGADWPDVEYLELDAYYGAALLPQPAMTVGANYAAILSGLTAPFSRGNVTISSNDTAVNPIVSPNWLEDPRDREVLIAAFKRARQVWTSDGMRGAIAGQEAFPGSNITSDEDIFGAIMSSAQTIWHASATCKMGKENDTMAVVDSKAKVMGVKNLRVVDISAFPFLPPGQPQSTVYALAEKISEIILLGL